jgi:hypothetical protein
LYPLVHEVENEHPFIESTPRVGFPNAMPIEQRAMMVLEAHAYFDESGTHQESDVVVVAGFLNTPEKWLTFLPLGNKLSTNLVSNFSTWPTSLMGSSNSPIGRRRIVAKGYRLFLISSWKTLA